MRVVIQVEIKAILQVILEVVMLAVFRQVICSESEKLFF
jgi:hypothetical protein